MAATASIATTATVARTDVPLYAREVRSALRIPTSSSAARDHMATFAAPMLADWRRMRDSIEESDVRWADVFADVRLVDTTMDAIECALSTSGEQRAVNVARERATITKQALARLAVAARMNARKRP